LTTIRAASAPVLAGVAGVLSCALVVPILGSATPVDRALPLVAVLITILAVACRRFAELVLVAIPILLSIAIGVGEERVRLLAYGLTIAGAVVAAFLGLAERGNREIDGWRAVTFVIALTALLRGIPVSLPALPGLGVILAGIASLTVALGSYRRDAQSASDTLVVGGATSHPTTGVPDALCASLRVSAHVLPLMIAVAVATPMTPLRATLFPVLLAVLLLVSRSRSIAAIAGAVVIALLAGTWALLLVTVSVVPVLLPFPRSHRDGNFVALPALRFGAAGLARVFAFAPSVIHDAISGRATASLSAIVLWIVAIVVRPGVGLLYLVAAAVLLLPIATTEIRSRLATPSLVFALLWVVLFAWSGAIAPVFPLPVALIAVLVISAVTLIPSMDAAVRLSGAIAAAAFVAFVFLVPPRGRFQVVERGAAPGEAVTVVPEHNGGRVGLVISGTNLADFGPGTLVGRIEIADARGRGYRRDLTMRDFADWGAFRGTHFFTTQNSVPTDFAPLLRGFGNQAFLGGLGRVALDLSQPVETITLSADPGLPPNARLEIHHLELRD
jgi:hypothetical protein